MGDPRLTTPTTVPGWERLRRCTVAVAGHHVETELHGQAVILQLQTRRFHGLDPIGTHVWQLLKTRRSIGELRDAIVAEYEVDPAQCEADLVGLLQDLETAGLLDVQDGEAP